MATLNQPRLKEMLKFLRERQKIYQRKEVLKLDGPWTSDPILRDYFFCNVFRRQDSGTKFYIEEIQQKSNDFPELLFRAISYRFCNEPESYKKLPWGEDASLPLSGMLAALRKWEPPQEGKFLRRAYIIFPQLPKGSRATDYYKEFLLSVLIKMLETDVAAAMLGASTLEECYSSLVRLCQGKLQNGAPINYYFVCWEVLNDLLYSGYWPFTEDEWAYIGGGCAEGLDLLYGPIATDENKAIDNTLRLKRLQETLKQNDFRITLCDLEHATCEYRKYYNLKHAKIKPGCRLYHSDAYRVSKI